MAGRPPYKFSPKKKAEFLRLLEEGTRRGAAAKAIGLSRVTIANHMKADAEFAGAVDDAEMHADEAVEDAMYQAACAGNVVACQVWLYNRQPHKWADRRKVDVAAAVMTGSLTEDQLREKARRLGIPDVNVSDLEGGS